MFYDLLKDAKDISLRIFLGYWKALVDTARVMVHVWVWTYVIWQILWMFGVQQVFGQAIYAPWEVDVRFHPTIILIYTAFALMIAYPLGMIRNMITEFKSGR